MRLSQRHQRRDRVVRGHAQQLADLRLHGHGHGRDGPAEAGFARRQQDVPHQRIDRRAGDDADAVELLVGGRDGAEIEGEDQHHRGRHERLDEGGPGLGGGDLGRRDAGRGERVPRHLAGRGLRGVARGRRPRQSGQAPAHGRVAHDDDAHALAVAAARRETRHVEDVEQDGVGQRLAGVVARREGGAHDLAELHRGPLSRRCGIFSTFFLDSDLARNYLVDISGR